MSQQAQSQPGQPQAQTRAQQGASSPQTAERAAALEAPPGSAQALRVNTGALGGGKTREELFDEKAKSLNMLLGEHRFATQAKDLVRQTLGQNKVTETIVIYRSNAEAQKAHPRLSSSDSVAGALGDRGTDTCSPLVIKERQTFPAQKPQPAAAAFRGLDGSSAGKRRPHVGEPVKIFKNSVAISSKLKLPRSALAKEQPCSAQPKPQTLALRETTPSSSQLQNRRREPSTEANSELQKHTESTTRRSVVGSLAFSKPHKGKVGPLELKIDPSRKPRAAGLAKPLQKSDSRASVISDRLLVNHKANQLLGTSIIKFSPRAEKSRSNKATPHKAQMHFELPNRRLHSVESTPTLHSRTLSDKIPTEAVDNKLRLRNGSPARPVSNLLSPKVNIKVDSPSRLLAMLSTAVSGRQPDGFFRQITAAAESRVELDLGLSRHHEGSNSKRTASKPSQPNKQWLSRQVSQSSQAQPAKKNKRSHTVLSEAQEVAEEHEKLMSRIAVLNRDMWPDIDARPK